MLYLHEIIDIIGTGQESYLDTVGARAEHSGRAGISRLMGSWKVIGSTGRWPRVVNLWEMESWAHWAQTLERQFVPEKKDAALAPWWAEAAQWRSGGYDRILEPASYARSRAQLQKGQLRAGVCVHTLVRLYSGMRRAYLEALAAVLQPALERRGLTLFGAYSSAMRADEAIVLWAAPDFQMLCAVYADRRQSADLCGWTARVRRIRRSYDTMWLVPSRHCFFHPSFEQSER